MEMLATQGYSIIFTLRVILKVAKLRTFIALSLKIRNGIVYPIYNNSSLYRNLYVKTINCHPHFKTNRIYVKG